MKLMNHTNNVLTKLKDKVNIQDNYKFVYRIDCNDRDKYYICHTPISLRTRLYYHKLSLKPLKM